MPEGLTPFDLAVIAVVVGSGMLALYRGFVREVLSVAGWVGAALVTLYAFAHVQPWVRRWVEPPLLADALTGMALFVVSLFLFSWISSAISKRVRESAVGPVDRSLGFLFGLLRGAVVACLAWLAIAWVMPPADQPDWLRQARTAPLLARGAELLARLAPGEQQVPKPARGPAKAAAPTDLPRPAGYKSGDRRALERLIDGQDREAAR